MQELEYRGVTIDSAHSKDLDDAVWVDRTDDGWSVTVSIALVAEVVKDGTDIDQAAFENAFTRYAAQDVRTSMLPVELAEKSLSLLPDRTKRVMGTVLRLDETLRVVSCEPGFGKLLNKGRLTHEMVGDLIEKKENDLHPMIARAWELASGLLAKRRQGGALAFFSLDSGVMADEEGRLIEIGTHRGISRAYIIVQELMILANASLAEYFASRGVRLIFRNHRGNPVADRSALVEDLAVASGGGTHSESAMKRLGMMLERATLSPQATGHYALNLPVYAWFTSPIRRYADLVNQRIAMAVLSSEPSPYSGSDLDVISGRLNDEYQKNRSEQAAGLKAASERRAAKALLRKDFARLDDLRMTAVIKACLEGGAFDDGLLDELELRLSANGLTEKDIGRLLRAGSTFRARRIAALYLQSASHRAVSVLNHFEQDRIADTILWEDGVDASRFTARVTLEIAGSFHVGSASSTTKKSARQTAAAKAISLMAGVEWSGDDEGAVDATSGTVAVQADPNAKGNLISFCQVKKFGIPSFEVTQAGASHAPSFTATVTVCVRGADVRSDPFTAATRRDAERSVAALMLDRLSRETDVSDVNPHANIGRTEHQPGAGPRGSASHANPKNELQEICQKKGWPLPVYDFKQTGPSHAPLFAASATVSTPAGKVTSPEVSGTSRKEAEKLAAEALLSKVA